MVDASTPFYHPHVYRGRILPMARNKDWETKPKNITEVITENARFAYALEAAYKIIQNLPKDVRQAFLRACEDIK
ncbi:MAG: hypothetical protein A2Z08_07985 [Deltaproteobacteria bacterium RBG_16_54_11]|nr:MAG: hypothetical protein A2Z08_07985 [Deltaproteobacteria bacterium RBG_16_54_11]